MRRIYRMYLLCKRFLLHYTRSVGGAREARDPTLTKRPPAKRPGALRFMGPITVETRSPDVGWGDRRWLGCTGDLRAAYRPGDVDIILLKFGSA